MLKKIFSLDYACIKSSLCFIMHCKGKIGPYILNIFDVGSGGEFSNQETINYLEKIRSSIQPELVNMRNLTTNDATQISADTNMLRKLFPKTEAYQDIECRVELNSYYLFMFELVLPGTDIGVRHAIAFVTRSTEALVFDDNFGFFRCPIKDVKYFLYNHAREHYDKAKNFSWYLLKDDM